MSHEQTVFRAARWISWSALAFALASCGGEVGSAGSSGATDTQIEGERFTALETSSDRLTGVFVKDNRSLAFDVDHRNGGSAFTLSTASGEVLYSVVRGPTGSETHIGSSYRSVLPHPAGPPAPPSARNYSPAKFESSGNLKDALDALKGTPIELLPYLAAALGRLGMDGSRAPIALPVHMTAMRLTKELGLQLDNHVLETTNQAIASAASAQPPPSQTSTAPVVTPSQTAPDSSAPADSIGSTVHTEGFQNPAPIPCPSGRPPCAAGMIVPTSGLLAGCCVPAPPPTPVPPPDYSATVSCSSGAAREVFSNMTQDPCRDDCLGLCGPDCHPWDWVCGDERVHAACWNHDSAYCPSSFNVWGVDIPNPDYPICYAEWLVYSAEIGVDTILGPLCANDWATDLLTRPWPGLWTIVPGYEVTYQNAPAITVLNPPSAYYYSSSVLPGWDSWAHGPAQAGDHMRLPATSWLLPWTAAIDGNFFDGAVFHSDWGYLGWQVTGAPPGQYWYVDLGAPKNITRIMIYNRTDYWNYPNGRLTNFQALIWDSTNWTWIPIADDSSFQVAPAGSGIEYPLGTDGSMQDFNPRVGTNSQYVMIAKTDADYLVLGDVVIWGY